MSLNLEYDIPYLTNLKETDSGMKQNYVASFVNKTNRMPSSMPDAILYSSFRFQTISTWRHNNELMHKWQTSFYSNSTMVNK